jgi:hypothetical protein
MIIKIIFVFCTLFVSSQAQDNQRLKEQLKEIQQRKPNAMHGKWPALAQGPENYLKTKIEKSEQKKREQTKIKKSK